MSDIKNINDYKMRPLVFEEYAKTDYRDTLLNINVQRHDDQLGIVLPRRWAWNLVRSLLSQLENTKDDQIALWFLGKLKESDEETIIKISSLSRR